MTQNQISTISEFLLHAGTDYRVFDMGRSIRPISSQCFLDWETAKAPPIHPRAGHAWIGIVFWDKSRSQHQYIWFIKLPVDEQGLLVAASRNQFLQIIVEALGTQLENAEKKNGQLPDNPYTFVPNQQQLADFNSHSRKTLGLGTSSYYAATVDYLRSPMVIDWQTLALQGFADVVANMPQDDIAQTINQHFSVFPQAVQNALLTSMENTNLSDDTMATIESWLLADKTDITRWVHGLRALCAMQSEARVIKLVSQALTFDVSDNTDCLAVISGRLWLSLLSENNLMNFMHKAAIADPTFGFFQGMFGDLVRIPSMRHAMLSLLREPEKSPQLTQAVGSLFSNSTQSK